MVIFEKKYIKKGTFLKFLKSKFDLNIHQKRTKLHHFKKNFSGGMPPNPPSKAHGFAMRGMSLRDMQIFKSQKKFLDPLPNPGYAPDYACGICTNTNKNNCILDKYISA